MFALVSVLLIFEALVLIQAILAFGGGFLTVHDMQSSKVDCGLPFVWHLGMWGDIVFVSPLVAYVVMAFGGQWSIVAILSCAAIGAVVSIAMHHLYRMGEAPGLHARDGRVTDCGWVHAGYIAAAITVLLLFYFRTTGVDRPTALITSIGLVLHMFLGGTQIPIALLRKAFPTRFEWWPWPTHKEFGAWATNVAVTVLITVGYLYQAAHR